jgi:hypothetical protein
VPNRKATKRSRPGLKKELGVAPHRLSPPLLCNRSRATGPSRSADTLKQHRALVAAMVWAVFAYFTGWEYWLAAVGVGFAVGWAVRRHARSTTRRPGLGVAAALIAFAAMMAGSVFLHVRQVAEALHVSVIRVAENPAN